MGKYDFDAATHMIEQWKKEHRWKSRGWMLNKIGEMWMGSIKESSIQDETIDFLTRKLEATFSALKAINDEKNSLEKKANALYGVSGELEFEGIKECIDAVKEDRGIIPPVRIGETIYHITTCKNFPQVLDGTMYDSDGGPGTATGYYCPCELQENCPYSLDDDGEFDCDKHKNELAVFTDTVESIFVSQTEEVMNFGYSGSADFSAFGRTVFKDYDKAKAALEEIKNGKNG